MGHEPWVWSLYSFSADAAEVKFSGAGIYLRSILIHLIYLCIRITGASRTVSAEDAFHNLSVCHDRRGITIISAKGAFHTSLGQRPRGGEEPKSKGL